MAAHSPETVLFPLALSLSKGASGINYAGLYPLISFDRLRMSGL